MSQQPGQLHDDFLTQMKFDYAWRYFSLHARQRVTMFNFFLLGSGVLGNACVLLLREQLDWQAGVVAAIGFFVSLVAIGLDVRNNQLVRLGEEALRRVERDHLILVGKNPPEYAILTLDRCQEQSSEKHKRILKWLLKHKVSIRSVEGIVAIVYLGAALYSFGVLGFFYPTFIGRFYS